MAHLWLQSSFCLPEVCNIFMMNESKCIKRDGQIRNGDKIFIAVSERICGTLHVNWRIILRFILNRS